MATRAELGDLLGVLQELQGRRFPDLPLQLVQEIAEAESRNLDNRKVALTEVRRLIEAEVAKHP